MITGRARASSEAQLATQRHRVGPCSSEGEVSQGAAAHNRRLGTEPLTMIGCLRSQLKQRDARIMELIAESEEKSNGTGNTDRTI